MLSRLTNKEFHEYMVYWGSFKDNLSRHDDTQRALADEHLTAGYKEYQRRHGCAPITEAPEAMLPPHYADRYVE